MGIIGKQGGGGQGTPELLVVGIGSYTIPVGKFGFFSACSASASTKSGSNSNSGTGGSGSGNSAQQWVPTGTMITVSGGSVSLDGTAALRTTSTSVFQTLGAGNSSSSSIASWSVAIYSI